MDLPPSCIPAVAGSPPCRQRTGWLLLSALAVASGAWLMRSHWNTDLLVAQHRQPGLPGWLWLLVTVQGDGWVMFAFVSALDHGRRTLLAVYLRCALLLALLAPLAKSLLPVPRPAAMLPGGSLHVAGPLLVGANSFPSGHAMTAGACAAILCLLLPCGARAPVAVRMLRFAIGADMALVAYSRTAVGAHWPADALLGFGIGILVAVLAVQAEKREPWATRLQTRAGCAGIALLQLLAVAEIFRLGADGRAAPAVAVALGLAALLPASHTLRRLMNRPKPAFGAG